MKHTPNHILQIISLALIVMKFAHVSNGVKKNQIKEVVVTVKQPRRSPEYIYKSLGSIEGLMSQTRIQGVFDKLRSCFTLNNRSFGVATISKRTKIRTFSCSF